MRFLSKVVPYLSAFASGAKPTATAHGGKGIQTDRVLGQVGKGKVSPRLRLDRDGSGDLQLGSGV